MVAILLLAGWQRKFGGARLIVSAAKTYALCAVNGPQWLERETFDRVLLDGVVPAQILAPCISFVRILAHDQPAVPVLAYMS